MFGLQHRAAAAGHTCVVKYLLEQGVDPNCRKSKAKTPLHEAAAGGHGAIIELLLARSDGENVARKAPVGHRHFDDWHNILLAAATRQSSRHKIDGEDFR